MAFLRWIPKKNSVHMWLFSMKLHFSSGTFEDWYKLHLIFHLAGRNSLVQRVQITSSLVNLWIPTYLGLIHVEAPSLTTNHQNYPKPYSKRLVKWMFQRVSEAISKAWPATRAPCLQLVLPFPWQSWTCKLKAEVGKKICNNRNCGRYWWSFCMFNSESALRGKYIYNIFI